MQNGDSGEADEELVGGGPQQRNWRGIGIALLVIISMCALIVLAVVFMKPPDVDPESQPQAVTLDEVISGRLSGVPMSAVWAGSERLVWEDEQSDLIAEDVASWPPASALLQDSAPFGHLKPLRSWTPNAAGNFVAFSHHAQKHYKHSWLSAYSIRDVRKKTYEVVAPRGKKTAAIRAFLWSPQPRSSDFVFVFEGDVWYQSSPSAPPFRVSSSGDEANGVLNGVPDWLYEEEILGSDKALWWSPSGGALAWAEFNDSGVEPIRFPLYYSHQLYPTIRSIPYPKVGKALPTVALHLWRRSLNRSERYEPPREVTRWAREGGYYLNGAAWAGNWGGAAKEVLLVSWSNRWANQTAVTACDPAAQACTLLHAHDHRWNGMELWATPAETLAAAFKPEAKEYFTLLPEGSASAQPPNAFTHVARVHDGHATFLKQGDYDVTQIHHYDAGKDELYFTAAAPLPRQRNVFRTAGSGDAGTAATCLTCFMEEELGCSYVRATFPPVTSAAPPAEPRFLLHCSGPERPRLFLAKAGANGSLALHLLQNNTELGEALARKALPLEEYRTVELDSGYEAIVKLSLPPDFDPASADLRYPMLLHVYGGPGSQEVSAQFGVNFDTYMSSRLGTIVAKVDGRGSGLRGWRYRHPILHAFGQREVADQLETVRKLIAQDFFIKDTALGVWGWSYGGFATGQMVEKGGADLFNCAVAVAPVTDFRLYDAAYTERYMGPGAEQARAYEATRLGRNVSAYRALDFLLVHGSGDDNVHYQNSALLTKALTKANVQFRLMIYPNQQHSISGDRPHLWTLLHNFFSSCLQLES